MKTWAVAKRSGSQARAGAQAERAGGRGFEAALPLAKERFEKQVCVYCQGRAGRKTGYLAITGKVFYCKDHAKLYQEDKIWEARHKKSM